MPHLDTSQPQFALIGCGLIGQKRAASLPPRSLAWACDLDIERAKAIAHSTPTCRSTSEFSEIMADPSVDAVIVSTLNSSLAPISLSAVRAGKHVLVEKPGALNVTELEQVAHQAEETGAKVRIGYNHRYHPALQKAREIIDSGVLGPLMFMRGRYGHGGRKGYDREWRANPALSGGGELIDQGVHLIDLSGWFLGPFSSVEGHANTLYWDMKVDDNAFLSLKTETGQTAWLHVSCTEWKNMFSLEIYGRNGKLAIDGLGRSYGTEQLHYYKMLPEMGPPETTKYEYPGSDSSWQLEIQDFIADIQLDRTPQPGIQEGILALNVVQSIYRKSGYLKP